VPFEKRSQKDHLWITGSALKLNTNLHRHEALWAMAEKEAEQKRQTKESF
jgi:hypothetical protein